MVGDVLQYLQLQLSQQSLQVGLADELRRQLLQQPVQGAVLLVVGKQEPDGLSDLGIDLIKSRGQTRNHAALYAPPLRYDGSVPQLFTSIMEMLHNPQTPLLCFH